MNIELGASSISRQKVEIERSEDYCSNEKLFIGYYCEKQIYQKELYGRVPPYAFNLVRSGSNESCRVESLDSLILGFQAFYFH